MTIAEAAKLLAIRQVLWPHTALAEGDMAMVEVETWAMMLGDLDSATVLAAMRSKQADAFAPTIGQLVEAIHPTPTYADALDEFRQMLHAGYGMNRWRDAPWSHPLIASFAERHFVEWCMSPDGTFDGQAASEAAARAHFRESFKAVQQRWSAGAISAATEEHAAIGAGRQIGDGDERA